MRNTSDDNTMTETCTLSVNLAQELHRAAELCGKSSEEEGGIILSGPTEGQYEFIKLRNIYAGLQIALGLYEADDQELIDKVLSQVKTGAKMYASFHTHPSFSPTPSNLDLTKLFTSFKHNFIYATERRLYSISEWVGEGGNNLHITYVPQHSISALLNL